MRTKRLPWFLFLLREARPARSLWPLGGREGKPWSRLLIFLEPFWYPPSPFRLLQEPGWDFSSRFRAGPCPNKRTNICAREADFRCILPGLSLHGTVGHHLEFDPVFI